MNSQIVADVKNIASGYRRVLVFVDSNHNREHVLAELEAFAPLVKPSSYCVVFDTIIEDLPAESFPYRLWGRAIILKLLNGNI